MHSNRYALNNASVAKLNTINSNSRIDGSTPSPNQLRSNSSKTNNKPETYYHVNVAQLKSKFDNNISEQKPNNLNVKTLDKKNSDSILLSDNRNVMRQFNNNLLKNEKSQKDLDKELNKRPNLNEITLRNCDNYQVNNFQTEQLEALQKETERIEQEKSQIAHNINETDLKIAKCRQKIQVLMDEIQGKKWSCYFNKVTNLCCFIRCFSRKRKREDKDRGRNDNEADW